MSSHANQSRGSDVLGKSKWRMVMSWATVPKKPLQLLIAATDSEKSNLTESCEKKNNKCLLFQLKNAFPAFSDFVQPHTFFFFCFNPNYMDNSKCFMMGLYTVTQRKCVTLPKCIFLQCIVEEFKTICIPTDRITAHEAARHLICAQSASTSQYLSIDLPHQDTHDPPSQSLALFWLMMSLGDIN